MKGCVENALHSLSSYIILLEICRSGSCHHIETEVNVNLLCAVSSAAFGSVNNDSVDKLVHDLRGKLRKFLILLDDKNIGKLFVYIAD